MAERIEGTVKWFNEEKGYGFIERHDGGDDVFVHYSSLRQTGFATLRENERVEFEVTQGDKGLKASDVVTV